jgi:hypothetical protein
VKIFLEAGALDDAERLLDAAKAQAESPSDSEHKLRQELEALKARRAGSATPRPPGDF